MTTHMKSNIYVLLLFSVILPSCSVLGQQQKMNNDSKQIYRLTFEHLKGNTDVNYRKDSSRSLLDKTRPAGTRWNKDPAHWKILSAWRLEICFKYRHEPLCSRKGLWCGNLHRNSPERYTNIYGEILVYSVSNSL